MQTPEERYRELYDQCENCSARQAERTCAVGGVEERLCGHCAASLETLVNPLLPEGEGSAVYPDYNGDWTS